MCVFENRQQDVKVTLSGQGDRRIITGSEIGFEGKKIWVALLEAPQDLAHARAEARRHRQGHPAGLDDAVPGPVARRFHPVQRPDRQLGDAAARAEERQVHQALLARQRRGADRSATGHRWNTVLGEYPYPCWSDPDRRGYLQPLKSSVLQLQGPVVVYPINRVTQTPLDIYTVVDVMRNTLGVGPCQHILDLEGQKSEYKGMATCEVRDTLTPIYEKNEQKEKRAEVDKTLDDGLTFVKHIRGRITRYVEFGKKMRQYLADQKKAHPELSEFIAEMDRLTQRDRRPGGGLRRQDQDAGPRRADERGLPQGGAGL